jgi:hypothetical protein
MRTQLTTHARFEQQRHAWRFEEHEAYKEQQKQGGQEVKRKNRQPRVRKLMD